MGFRILAIRGSSSVVVFGKGCGAAVRSRRGDAARGAINEGAPGRPQRLPLAPPL